MKWFRFFSEARNDPKVQMLTSDQFRLWVNLLCLANEQDERGTLPPDEEIPYLLHIRRDAFGKMISSLTFRKLFVRTPEGRLKPKGWDERQKDSDDAGRRKARYREKTYGKSREPNVPGHGRDTERDTGGTRPAPRARVSEILDLENSYTHGVNEDATTHGVGWVEPEGVALPSTPQRTGDDARRLAEAERLLGSDPRTEPLGLALSREHNTPDLIGIEGWRWLRAAERILSPGRSASQRNSLQYLASTARNLTEDEKEPKPATAPSPNGHAANPPPRKPPSVARRDEQISKLKKMIEEQSSESTPDGDG